MSIRCAIAGIAMLAASALCAQDSIPAQGPGQASTAEGYFNRAARQYVKEDKMSALRTLDRGLQEYPGDARMLKLAEELLKQQQQQQQQKQQQEQQQQEQRKQQEQQKKEQEQAKQQEREQRPEEIDPKDAERILDALQRQEKDTQEKVRAQMRPARKARVEKDW